MVLKSTSLSASIRARLAKHDAEVVARKKKARNAQKLRSERLRNGVDTANMRKTLDGQPRTPVSMAQKLVAIRLPPQMIEDVKVQASRFDMTWQPFMRLLVLQGLHHLNEHNSLDIPTTSDAEAKALRAQQRAAFVAERKAEAAQEEQTSPPAPKQKRQKKGAPSDTPVATSNDHHTNGVSTEHVEGEHLVATPMQEGVILDGTPFTEPRELGLGEHTMEINGVVRTLVVQDTPNEEAPSKAALLRALLEEHEGPAPTTPAAPPTASEEQEGQDIVTALTTSSIPPAPPREVFTPPGPDYSLMQASESGEEMAVLRDLPTYVRPTAPEGSTVHTTMNGSALAVSTLDKIVQSLPPKVDEPDEEITPELAAIFFPEEEDTHGQVDVPDGPVPLMISTVDTAPVSEPVLSKEATSEEIDALLGGDSSVSGDIDLSAEDMMEAVLNQFGPSEAEPEVASARDESSPHLPHTPESSEDDFQDLLNSL